MIGRMVVGGKTKKDHIGPAGGACMSLSGQDSRGCGGRSFSIFVRFL